MPDAVDAGLPRDAMAPRLARELVRETFGRRLAGERLDALTLAVSELVANAVMHGEGPIELRVRIDGDRILGEVVDGGGGFERELRERGPEDVNGRGLLLVAAVADDWGVHEGTTHVWFELHAGGDSSRPAAPQIGADERPRRLDRPA